MCKGTAPDGHLGNFTAFQKEPYDLDLVPAMSLTVWLTTPRRRLEGNIGFYRVGPAIRPASQHMLAAILSTARCAALLGVDWCRLCIVISHWHLS